MKERKEIIMKLQNETIIMPLPEDSLIEYFEDSYGPFVLPEDYKMFLKKYNGVVPETRVFDFHDYEYVVEQFLCLLERPIEDPINGMYEIRVVMTQLDERLQDGFDEDATGYQVVPIAALFAGNFLCLDYRTSDVPSIAIWFHEESEEYSPEMVKIADSFSEFLDMLYESEE